MIGRKKEVEILRECATADRSRLVVVYGRRRVGKTFMIREALIIISPLPIRGPKSPD